MSVLEGSSILLTGGTGSFGKSIIRHLLDEVDPARIVIFSRDELKQYECRQLFKDDPRLRWPAQPGVVLEQLAAFVLLELITAEDDDASWVDFVQQMANYGLAK